MQDTKQLREEIILDKDVVEVREMKAGYELVFWKDGAKSLIKANSTWGNTTRAISHLTNKIEELEQSPATQRKEILEEVRNYVNNTLQLLDINHGRNRMKGSWLNVEDLLQKLSLLEGKK